MKIVDVKSYLLRATLEQGFGQSQSFGRQRSAVLVEVTTDEGITGWGEAGAGRNQDLCRSTVDALLKPLLVGENPLETDRLWETMFNPLITSQLTRGVTIQALSGVDIALWDICGKALNLPIHTLLGGAHRDRVTAYATGLYYVEAADQAAAMADEAAEYVALGFKGVKMKIGGAPPEDDLRRARAIRRAIGDDVRFMVDANQGYNAFTAKWIGRRLADLDILWFEEPVPADDLEGYLDVKAGLPMVPIAGGETLYTRFAFRDFVARRAFDIAQPDAANTGGFTECRRIAALTRTFGLQYNPHVWGTPIALAAGLHLAASLPPQPYCRQPSPFFQEPVVEYDRTPNPLREELAVEPFDVEEGTFAIPTKPGLGVEIDRRALERYVQ